MYKALINKEILKTRRAFWCCLALSAFFTGYAILGINRVIATHGVEHVWLIMLMKDQIFIDAVKYVPLLCGLLIGLAQMMPEMQSNRLKLTLHLPVGAPQLLFTMLGAGFGELTAIYLLQAAAIALYFFRIVTPEMTGFVLGSTIPWFLAGYTAYFFTCAIALEGKWRRRILLALLGFGMITIFFLQAAAGAYESMWVTAVVCTLLTAFLSYYSIIRFKQGLID